LSSRSENAAPSNYLRLLESSKTSRQINAVLCCVGILASAAAVFLVPAEYRLFAAACAALISCGLLVILLKSLKEARAVEDIAETSVYAAMLTSEQQRTVRKYLVRRGQSLYFATFLFCVAPESVVLSGLFYMSKNRAYLLFMAVFAALALACVLISGMYLSVRLSPSPSTVTVSQRGILVGREVIPFDAESGDALQLLRFQDYYYLRFIRQAILGIRYVSEIIFPTEGALRQGLRAPADEEIVKALGLSDIYVTEDEFYESRSYVDDEPEPEKPVKEKKAPKEHRKKRRQQPEETFDDFPEEPPVTVTAPEMPAAAAATAPALAVGPADERVAPSAAPLPRQQVSAASAVNTAAERTAVPAWTPERTAAPAVSVPERTAAAPLPQRPVYTPSAAGAPERTAGAAGGGPPKGPRR